MSLYRSVSCETKYMPNGIDEYQSILINRYIDILYKWNDNVALVSRKSNFNIDDHIRDCISLMHHIKINDVILDVGSGNGMPGVILSICGFSKVKLVEINMKKSAFLSYVCSVLQLDAAIINQDVKMYSDKCDVLVSKAFSKIDHFLKIIGHIHCRQALILTCNNNYMKYQTSILNYCVDNDCTHRIFSGLLNSNSIVLELLRNKV